MKKIVLALASLTVISCGEKKEDTSDTTVYATINVTNTLQSANDGELKMTSKACSYDKDNSIITATFGGANKSSLYFRLKGAVSSAKDYTCVQSEDNRAIKGSVGSKYETCGVDVNVLASATSTDTNTYSTYRSDTTTPLFTYAGVCTVSVSDASTVLKGTISCKKMVRTMLEGLAPNPINTDATADISGSFECPL